MSASRSRILVGAIVTCGAISVFACNGGVQPITRSIAPSIGSLYAALATVDDNQACVTPSPTPAAPDPQAWWAAIDPETRRTKVAVGYEFWSNSNPSCRSARQDVYRGVASYDLATLAALSTPSTTIQSLITSAKVELTIGAGTPAQVAVGRCVANFGGVASIEQLRPGYTVLTGLTVVPLVPPLVGIPQFPAGANSTSLTGVAVPGTSGRITTSVGGLGQTVVVVDVKDLLAGALTRGDISFGIMLVGSTEDMQTAPADPQAECRTLVTVGKLEVQHL